MGSVDPLDFEGQNEHSHLGGDNPTNVNFHTNVKHRKVLKKKNIAAEGV